MPGAYDKLDASQGGSALQRSIREKINTIVQKEIDLVEFKNKVSTEELAAETYNEVITKKNFFF